MNLLDDEVFAVIIAIIVVGSVFSGAQLLRPSVTEPFTAIGLLNENCKIGVYPDKVFRGENLTLCIFLYNYMGYPLLMQVRYKIGSNTTLPTNSTPSPMPTILVFNKLLDHGENTTFYVEVPIKVNESFVGKRIALIFELWIYDIDHDKWVYSGRWNHLYVEVLESPIP